MLLIFSAFCNLDARTNSLTIGLICLAYDVSLLGLGELVPVYIKALYRLQTRIWSSKRQFFIKID